MYLNGEIVKTQLQEMKNEQNRNQASEEGRVAQLKNKTNTQNSFYKDVFSFRKRFDLNKFEAKVGTSQGVDSTCQAPRPEREDSRRRHARRTAATSARY